MQIFLPSNRLSFYSRSTIPRRIRSFFKGRREVWRSLRTTDKELAHVRAVRWHASGRQLFLTLKRYGGRMTQEEIETLVQRWLDTVLNEADHDQLMAGPLSDQQYIDRDGDLTGYQDILLERLRGNELERMTEEADQLLKSAGLPALDHDSLAFKQLCRRLLEAQFEWTAIQRSRLDGLYPAFRHRGNRNIVEVTPGAVEATAGASYATPQTTTPETPTKMFSEVVTLYYDENKPRSVRSGEQVQTELRRFIEIIGGDKPIGRITKDDCRIYKEHLMKTRSLSLVTVVKWLGIVSTIFRWSSRQGFTPDTFNPMVGLAPNSKRAKAESKTHRDYTDQELLQVFGSKIFLEQRDSRHDRYWLCLICLFTGCRREEAAQLHLQDIREQESIPYFSFTDQGEDQQLKNLDSRRKVPIHSALIQLGFLDYVQSLQKSGETRLFPTLKKKGKSTLGDATGKWYAKLLKRVGLKDNALVLHGLRHTFVTRLSDAGVPEKVKMMLAGHAAQGVHGKVYDHRERVSMKLLQEGLEKLRYDDVLQVLTNGQSEEESSGRLVQGVQAA